MSQGRDPVEADEVKSLICSQMYKSQRVGLLMACCSSGQNRRQSVGSISQETRVGRTTSRCDNRFARGGRRGIVSVNDYPLNCFRLHEVARRLGVMSNEHEKNIAHIVSTVHEKIANINPERSRSVRGSIDSSLFIR